MEAQSAPPLEKVSEPMSWYDPSSARKARPFEILPCLLNIRSHPISTLDNGFGQHWEKFYRIRLEGISISPEEVIAEWKKAFPLFWPSGNIFYPPVEGITETSIALMKLTIPGGSTPMLDTGIIAGPVGRTGFTFTAFAGHPISGSMTFSARSEDEVTIAQAHASLRASDPLYELAIRIFGEKEDEFWQRTLKNLAAHFGVEGVYSQEILLTDPRMQWSRWSNIRYNAGIRSAFYRITFPIRFIQMLLSGKRSSI